MEREKYRSDLTKFSGSYPLTKNNIEQNVKTEPGVYLLSGDDIHVLYVGRSDDDLQKRLLGHLKEGKYGSFWFKNEPDAKAAYNSECMEYHLYGGKRHLDNDIHPDTPDGMSHLTCPLGGGSCDA